MLTVGGIVHAGIFVGFPVSCKGNDRVPFCPIDQIVSVALTSLNRAHLLFVECLSELDPQVGEEKSLLPKNVALLRGLIVSEAVNPDVLADHCVEGMMLNDA